MSDVTIFRPRKGEKVAEPFAAYGYTQSLQHLLGLMVNSKGLYFGRTISEGPYWAIYFTDMPIGKYTFILLGVPGGLLGRVENVTVRRVYGGITQPPSGDHSLCPFFTTSGTSAYPDQPSGTWQSTDGTSGTVYGTMPWNDGAGNWFLGFNVPVDATRTYTLKVTVGKDKFEADDLQVPKSCI